MKHDLNMNKIEIKVYTCNSLILALIEVDQEIIIQML